MKIIHPCLANALREQCIGALVQSHDSCLIKRTRLGLLMSSLNKSETIYFSHESYLMKDWITQNMLLPDANFNTFGNETRMRIWCSNNFRYFDISVEYIYINETIEYHEILPDINIIDDLTINKSIFETSEKIDRFMSHNKVFRYFVMTGIILIFSTVIL